ncbi:unknown [Clostridium sp. CAG:524]|nr:unknown [Clostridium sp. CAG:524]
MKKFIKNNIAVLIAFLILFIFSTILCIRNIKSARINEESRIEGIEVCKEILKHDKYNEICLENIDAKPKKRSTLKTYYDIINDNVSYNSISLCTVFYFLIPFLVITSSLYNISKKFKNQDIKNHLTRESYNKYIKEIFLDSYKSVFIWPMITILLFMFSYIISNGSFEIIDTNSSFSYEILSNPVAFMLSNLLNTIFMSFFWTNIALLIVPDTRNYIVSVLESIMIYFGIALTNTFFVILLISKILNKDVEKYLDFLDVYTYNNRNLLSFNILCLSVALISGLLVYLKYKNKEKIIMKLERNS